jgi:hypothetical protein
MLSPLIYCYANGLFSTRRIERTTCRDLAVRYLCANHHPDYDTICEFRKNNFDAIVAAFVEVLELARELKLLRLGTVSLDGTHIKPNASNDKNVTYARDQELCAQLRTDMDQLLRQAEAADRQHDDPQKASLGNRSVRKAAQKDGGGLHAVGSASQGAAEAEKAEYQHKLAQRDQRDGKSKG